MSRPVVVKLGGGLARAPGGLAAAVDALRWAAGRDPLIVVPGGGVFADQVRTAEAELGLSPTATHWMATLAMDQYAHAIAALLPGSIVAHDTTEIAAAHEARLVPVLAPYAWMRAADVLPHSWAVTSDSIAAFIAGALDAERLVLLKPVAGPLEALVDPLFEVVLPVGLEVVVLGAQELDRLEAVINRGRPRLGLLGR